MKIGEGGKGREVRVVDGRSTVRQDDKDLMIWDVLKLLIFDLDTFILPSTM